MPQMILAIVLSVIFAQGLGMLWYSKVLFGGVWAQVAGMTSEKMEAGKKKMGFHIALALIGSATTAIVFACLMTWVVSGALQGMIFGAIIWVFVMIAQLDTVLWDGNPWIYFLINSFHSLVRLAGMGAIIGAFLP